MKLRSAVYVASFVAACAFAVSPALAHGPHQKGGSGGAQTQHHPHQKGGSGGAQTNGGGHHGGHQTNGGHHNKGSHPNQD